MKSTILYLAASALLAKIAMCAPVPPQVASRDSSSTTDPLTMMSLLLRDAVPEGNEKHNMPIELVFEEVLHDSNHSYRRGIQNQSKALCARKG